MSGIAKQFKPAELKALAGEAKAQVASCGDVCVRDPGVCYRETSGAVRFCER